MTALALAALLLVSSAPQTRDVTRVGGASIRGTVVSDEPTPRPIRHARVELSGDRSLSMVTGDDGVFTFSGLPAGRYVLTASTLAMGARGYRANLNAPTPTTIVLATNQPLGLTFVYTAGAVISGRVKDVSGVPIERAIVSATMPSRVAAEDAEPNAIVETETDDEGNYRLFGLAPGAYILSASSGSANPRDAGALTPVETFFPGVESATAAQVIDLVARDERFGVDITMRRAKAGVIIGTLVDAGGERLDGTVRLSRPGPIDDTRSIAVRGGAFSVTVAPGLYVLRASQKRSDETGDVATTVIDTAVATVEVIEGGRVDLPMVLHPPVTLSGQVTAAGSLTPPPQLSLTLSGQTTRATVRDDGRFVFANLGPGEYRLSALAGPSWLIEHAVLAGRDALAEPIIVGSVPITGLAVSVTNRVGGLSGRLTHANGAGAPELAIVVVNVDAAMWTSAMGRPLAIWPDTNGEWSAASLPEGEYRVAALSDLSAADLARPDFLASIVAAGTAATIASGRMSVLNLQIQ